MAGAIFAALGKVNQQIRAIEKDRRNEQQRFQYRGIDDIYCALHPHFAEAGIVIACDLVEQIEGEKTTNSGGKMVTRVCKFNLRLISCEDGSEVSIAAGGEGSDSGDKTIFKAQSMAIKYAMIAMFSIPTGEDDPDGESPDFSGQGKSRGNGASGRQKQQTGNQSTGAKTGAQQGAQQQESVIPSFDHSGEKITDQQFADLQSRLAAVGVDVPKFCAYIGSPSLAEIGSAALPDILKVVEQKEQKERAKASAK